MSERRPRTRLLALILLLVVTSAVSVFLGMRIASPRQLQAKAQPPQYAFITAPVRSQIVSQSVTFDGAVSSGDLVVRAAVPAGAASAVVTDLRVSVGQTVRSGEVLAAVSGRPVIALAGRFAPYRDVMVGDSGPDVRQLRAALTALGFRSGSDRPDAFGPATASAVRRLYQRVGFATPTSSPPAASEPTGSVSTPTDLGVRLPAAEVVFLPAGAARVASVDAAPAATVAAASTLLTLTSRAPTITGTVDPSVAATLVPGLSGTAVDPMSGLQFIVRTVASAPEAATATLDSSDSKSEASASPLVTVALVGQLPVQLPEQFNVTVTLRSTSAKVLAVPVTALTTALDESSRVQIIVDGKPKEVIVVAGLSGGGFVEVSSRDPLLVSGAQVVLGETAK